MLKMGVVALAVLGVGFGQDGVWVRGGKATPRGRQVIQLLEQAERRGLNPSDYDGPLWASRLAAMEAGESQGALEFDIALTEAARRYFSNLRYGRANPGVFRTLDRSSAPLPRSVQENIVEAADLSAGLRAIEPPLPVYGRTLAALELYRTLARNDDGERLPAVAKPVEPGDAYAGLPRLVRLLRTLGDLPLPADSKTYSGAIVEAVKRFQTRHGLEVDGRIGKATLAKLNVPLSERVRQLELALERWRWLPRDFSGPSVWVNLPEFRLRAFDSTFQTVLEMKIVAGGGALRHHSSLGTSAR